MQRRRFFKIAALALAFALLALSGCQKAETRVETLELPAARVGDIEIPLRELYAQYAAYLTALKSAGKAGPATNAELDSALSSVLEKLIEDRLEEYEARKQGYFDLTPEQENEVQAMFASRKQQTVDYYTAEAKRMKELMPDLVVEDYVATAIGNSAVDNGLIAADLDAYWALLLNYTRADYAVGRMKLSFLATVDVTEDEISEKYENIIAENRVQLAQSTGKYKDLETLYVKYGGDPVLVVPESYVRVKDIHTATLAEAQAAEARLDAGEAFDTVLGDCTADSDFRDYAVYRDKGKLLSPASSSLDWSGEVKSAVLALKSPGERTGIVRDGDGYHILLLAGAERAGTHALPDVRDALLEAVRRENFDEAWSTRLASWRKMPGLVKIFKKNISKLQF